MVTAARRVASEPGDDREAEVEHHFTSGATVSAKASPPSYSRGEVSTQEDGEMSRVRLSFSEELLLSLLF